MMDNLKTVTVKVTRHELIDLCLACSVIAAETEAGKWTALYSKLEEQLRDFDEKQKQKEAK